MAIEEKNGKKNTNKLTAAKKEAQMYIANVMEKFDCNVKLTAKKTPMDIAAIDQHITEMFEKRTHKRSRNDDASSSSSSKHKRNN